MMEDWDARGPSKNEYYCIDGKIININNISINSEAVSQNNLNIASKPFVAVLYCWLVCIHETLI